MFQDKEEDSFDAHIPNLDFFAKYGAYPRLFMFELNSY